MEFPYLLQTFHPMLTRWLLCNTTDTPEPEKNGKHPTKSLFSSSFIQSSDGRNLACLPHPPYRGQCRHHLEWLSSSLLLSLSRHLSQSVFEANPVVGTQQICYHGYRQFWDRGGGETANRKRSTNKKQLVMHFSCS